MRSRTLPDLPGRCRRCYLKEGLCLCGELPRIETATRFVVVRHVLEGFKSTNTARVAALALPNAEILEYDPEAPELARLGELTGDACLLFPGAAPWGGGRPKHLIVLDGTWRQTRRMLTRLPGLAALPRLSLPPPRVAPARLRRAPREESRSTLEAVAAAVALLEGEQKARPLEVLHAAWVERVLIGRGALPRSVRRTLEQVAQDLRP